MATQLETNSAGVINPRLAAQRTDPLPRQVFDNAPDPISCLSLPPTAQLSAAGSLKGDQHRVSLCRPRAVVSARFSIRLSSFGTLTGNPLAVRRLFRLRQTSTAEVVHRQLPGQSRLLFSISCGEYDQQRSGITQVAGLGVRLHAELPASFTTLEKPQTTFQRRFRKRYRRRPCNNRRS